MMFTIKNYKQPTGLSCKFWQQNETFEVKGPMGKPLGVSSTGLHVCFAGGTGVLPFMDLVAHVAFACLGISDQLGIGQSDRINIGNQDTRLSSTSSILNPFKLKFYVSFQNRKDFIGLELLQALDAYCKRNKMDNFELFTRLS